MTKLKTLLSQKKQISSNALSLDDAKRLLKQIDPQWTIKQSTPHRLVRSFKLENYKQTVHFVNLITNIAEQYNHHPKITFGWNNCTVDYTTHSSGSLSQKDFSCALAIDLIS